MKSSRILVGAVTAVVLAFSSLTSPASGGSAGHPGPTGNSSATVLMWNEIAVNTLIALPGPAGGAPPAAQVHVAMVQGAVYDAVNAIGPKRYQPYLLQRRFSARASKDAAVATAAYGVLRSIVSTVPNFPEADRATVLDTLATQFADALAGIRDGRSERRGIAAGIAAARAMIADRQDDGRFGPSQWVPSRAPGHWYPSTDPVTGMLILDPTPWVGLVDPFVMESPSQFRTAGPNALSSAAWAREFNEVKAIGEVDSTLRTAEQTYIARWWQSTPVRSWNQVARDLIARNGLGVRQSTRLLAMQNLSGADASINCWNDKYHFDFWRPWNAIARAAEDGNPATEPEAGWTPLISAPYPEHPSGHTCLDAAHTTILEMFFGDEIEGGFQITSISALLGPEADDPRTRTFDSFSQVLDEVVEARIWAGLHYRTADVQGETLGRNVAEYLAANFFQRIRHHHH